MSAIKILSENLANKIAAGEVAERPASVVKELTENSLDAGSSDIRVEIEQGGRELICISDNGSGMSRDDALLSVERFATSKIFDDDQLFSIKTLGFRGEALPSIAAVSFFSMITSTDSESGTNIVINGGRIVDVKDTGAPAGTMISVKKLFFNTPARRKFLKSINTEFGHITDTVLSIALGWHNVRFRLSHNGKVVKDFPAADSSQRAADVLGQDAKKNFRKIDFQAESVSISGWAGVPEITRKTSSGIYIYVNGRFVRDKIARHALLSGYEGRLLKGEFPTAALFITVPFDRVDINVHPTKHEVRFADQNKVYNAVKQAILQTLNSGNTVKFYQPVSQTYQIREPRAEEFIPYPSESAFSPGIKPVFAQKTEKPPESRIVEQPQLWKQRFFSELKIIGQFHNTYIVCESDGEMIFIDQHAAHERILYEQLKNKSRKLSPSVQQLLIPETIELSYTQAAIMEQIIARLRKYGFGIEPFGTNTFVVKSVPAVLWEKEISPIIIELIEKFQENEVLEKADKPIDEILCTIACHAAIRANQSLENQQIKSLLADLDKCENPSNCPHGRPTWVSRDMQYFEKIFKRGG